MLNSISQNIVKYAVVESTMAFWRNNRKLISIVVGLFTLASCSGGQNFSQFPGFKEFFENNVPLAQLPTESDVALLKKHKPAIFKTNTQPAPIDFYKDYISHGELVVEGKSISQNVSAELLNQYRNDPNALFKYTGDYKAAGTTVVYGRVDRQQISYNSKPFDFTFLTYNLVFPVSGILKGLGGLQSIGLSIGGNLNDWHQLDHYVAVTIALLDATPIAVTLQQHNYHTTYLIEDGLITQSTGKVAVDIAMRSNELYPHSSETVKHPSVAFLSPDNIEFLITGANKPMMAGYDITNGEIEVDYQLVFLPQTDAFYQFKGSLGKNRLLPGRSGPPGADYATLPGLMPRTVRLVTGYRTDNVQQEIDLFGALFDRKNFLVRTPAITPYKNRFFEAILK